MATDYLSAILHWRRHHASLDDTASATITTMLYACTRWLQTNPGQIQTADGDHVLEIKAELEAWLTTRDLTYRG